MLALCLVLAWDDQKAANMLEADIQALFDDWGCNYIQGQR